MRADRQATITDDVFNLAGTTSTLLETSVARRPDDFDACPSGARICI